MSVISLDEYRSRASSTDQALHCVCGSQWFRLDGRSTCPETAPNGAITLDTDGRVTGRLGDVVCVECGRVLSI